MQIWQAFILGLTQGFAEFLPISSSGHLVLLQRVFGIDIGGAELIFDIILHVGTLFAVCAVFYKDILELFQKPYKYLGYLIVATIPAGLVGIIADDWINKSILHGKTVGITLSLLFMITAICLFITEKLAKRKPPLKPLTLKSATAMGLAQMVAILPGISRSGSTICIGTLCGVKSHEVSKFSFIMSIPVILGSFAVSLVKGILNGEVVASIQAVGSNAIWCVLVGLITSALSGLFAIKVMLKAISKANYKWFSAYLVAISLICLVLQFTNLLN